MDLSINVKKDDLIDSLRAKVTSLKAEAATRVTELETERDSRVSTREKLAEYYVTVGEMLSAKRAVIVNPIVGGYPQESQVVSADPDKDPLPEYPTKSGRGQDTKSLNSAIANINDVLVDMTGKIEATIKLLEISSDTKIPVKTSDYEKLLGATLGRVGRYHY